MKPINSSKISQPHHDQEQDQDQDHQQVHPLPESDKQSIISTLPQANGWVSSDEVPVYNYQGFWYWAPIIRGILASQEPSKFEPSPSDIVICSIPKSGTTWLKALAFAITTRTRFDLYSEEHPLLTTLPHALNPTIEVPMSKNLQTLDHDSNLLSTHMSYSLLPKSLLTYGCKIVYICRDPKDTFVSLWHFVHKMRVNKDVTEPIPLHEAFELFCQGISPNGPYWDHVLGYWKAKLEQPERVLLLKYEDMMQDTVSHVQKLAEFVGCPFSNVEEKEGVITRIVEMCSFENLRNLEVNKSGTVPSFLEPTNLSNAMFYRKGKVGDWQNYLSVEMADRIDQITAEKLNPFGLQL